MAGALFGTFFFLLILDVPISIAIGTSSIVGLFLEPRVPWSILVQRMYSGLDSFTLMAVPFFMLAGFLMNEAKLTDRLVSFALAAVGHIRGGLGHTTVVSGMIMAGMTGSSSAEAAGIGSIMIPAMVRAGFDKPFTVALVSTASTIGVIIPPSIPMVFYAVLAEESVGALFLSGVIPGVLAGFGLMGLTYYFATRRNYPRRYWAGVRHLWREFLGAFPVLLIPVVILGGMILGFATATEVAVLAVWYSLFLGLFVYKSMKIRDLPRILWEASTLTAVPLLLLGTAFGFAWLLSYAQVPSAIGDFLQRVSGGNVVLMLLVVNIIFFIAGCVMESLAAQLILVPILLPLVKHLGISPIHFGLIVVFNLAIGLVTPPVAVCLFIGCSIAEMKIPEVMGPLIPCIGIMLAVLFLMTYMPGIVLWLPRLLMPGSF